MALLNDRDSSSKSIENLPGSGGLYILKQSHLLFDIVSSEQMHSENSKHRRCLTIYVSENSNENFHYNLHLFQEGANPELCMINWENI